MNSRKDLNDQVEKYLEMVRGHDGGYHGEVSEYVISIFNKFNNRQGELIDYSVIPSGVSKLKIKNYERVLFSSLCMKILLFEKEEVSKEELDKVYDYFLDFFKEKNNHLEFLDTCLETLGVELSIITEPDYAQKIQDGIDYN